MRPLQSIGDGNDQRKLVVTRKVDIFVATHFSSFSTVSTPSGRSRDSSGQGSMARVSGSVPGFVNARGSSENGSAGVVGHAVLDEGGDAVGEPACDIAFTKSRAWLAVTRQSGPASPNL